MWSKEVFENWTKRQRCWLQYDEALQLTKNEQESLQPHTDPLKKTEEVFKNIFFYFINCIVQKVQSTCELKTDGHEQADFFSSILLALCTCNIRT